MAENSRIEWCDHTFNPWYGCTKISPACDHCYAESWAKRSGLVTWGADRRRSSPDYWRQPLKWNRQAEQDGVRRKVFCASLADVFDNQVRESWRDDLWHLIAMTQHLDWLLLTKRPQNIAKMLPQSDGPIRYPAWPWPNVWLGTTVENQAEADRRIPHLLSVSAKVRFLSCEPLLGPLNLTAVKQTVDPGFLGDCLRWYHRGKCHADEGTEYPTINWVICGGESAHDARPMHPNWARGLRDQCQAAGVPFFLKQWGDWGPVCSLSEEVIDGCYHPAPERHPDASRRCKVSTCVLHSHGYRYDFYTEPGAYLQGTGAMMMMQVGKKRAGALLDGREWSEVPKLDSAS